jgi:hypothetical protein
MWKLASALTCLLTVQTALACPAPVFETVPVTADGSTLLDDGGVLLVTRAGGGGGRGGGDLTGLHLRADGVDAVVTPEYLAPMLSILRPRPGKVTKLELVDDRGTVLHTYAQDAGGKRLAAPAARVASTLTTQSRATPPRPYPDPGQMTVTLAQDPPADAVVLIVFQLGAGDKQGLAWSNVVAGQRVYSFAQGGKGCIPGPGVARQGSRLALAWIDVHGRTSAVSRPVTVAAAPRPR